MQYESQKDILFALDHMEQAYECYKKFVGHCDLLSTEGVEDILFLSSNGPAWNKDSLYAASKDMDDFIEKMQISLPMIRERIDMLYGETAAAREIDDFVIVAIRETCQCFVIPAQYSIETFGGMKAKMAHALDAAYIAGCGGEALADVESLGAIIPLLESEMDEVCELVLDVVPH